MLPYLVAFGALLHVLFWGAGLAMLSMPRPWARFWPILAPAAGAALQSLVVWVGAYANLSGTDRYAWPAEAIPLVLLGVGLRRRARAGIGRRLGAAARDLARFGAVWAALAATLAALVWPLTRAASGLTTVSLGSCDAADYAAGARVLKEFARSDRGGFLGLTEVVRVMSVDNFFDFWLRLNHFTPSALIAFNGTIFHCAPYEIADLLAMGLLAATVPVVFWVARALLRYPAGASVAIAALFGLNPLTWYAVAHVAMGQLLAAPAIALLTWGGVAMWRLGAPRPTVRRSLGAGGLPFLPILAIAYALLLGSYNFIVIVCFVPAAAYAAVEAARRDELGRLAAWFGWMALPFAVAGAVFWTRLAGLAERFRLFRAYDFGWIIPGLTPEGWLGIVRGPGLDPLPSPWRLMLAAAVILALALALWTGFARRGTRRQSELSVCLSVPVLLGYGYLLARGARLGTNASYDGYKLFSVFYPLLLPVFCLWVQLGWRGPRWARLAVAALALAVGACDLAAVRRFSAALASPPLVVDRELVELGKIEAMPAVGSVNLRIPDMWSRLWANAFLLRKPQYFLTHTYEGRRNTPPRGEWELEGGLVHLRLPGGDTRQVTAHYSLVRVASPYFLRVHLDRGWYPPERLARSDLGWRWTSGDATLLLENTRGRALRLTLRLDARSLIERDLELWAGGTRIATVRVGPERRTVAVPDIVIASGVTRLEFRSPAPASTPPPGDDRPLGFAAYGIAIDVGPDLPEVRI